MTITILTGQQPSKSHEGTRAKSHDRDLHLARAMPVPEKSFEIGQSNQKI